MGVVLVGILAGKTFGMEGVGIIPGIWTVLRI